MIKINQLTKSQIINLLIDHYKSKDKLLTRSQICKISKFRNDYDFLQPEYSKYVYSGIINVSDKKLNLLKKEKYSNRMIWSSNFNVASGFYKSKNYNVSNTNRVLIIGYFSDDFILNPIKISKLKEIKNLKFSKTFKLSELIKAEDEILTCKPVKIHSILHEKIL